MSKSEKYNLEERTTKLSENTIEFLRNIKKDIITIPIIGQLIRSITSIGANYCEANGASSRKDFKNKIHICKKETKESMYWLQVLAKAAPEHKVKCRELWRESQELAMIFSKIINTMENKDKNK
ncbi:MAG: four helix bundle protein [Parcubacteria group bacterium]|jgi:four helix bundle protein